MVGIGFRLSLDNVVFARMALGEHSYVLQVHHGLTTHLYIVVEILKTYVYLKSPELLFLLIENSLICYRVNVVVIVLGGDG
jgi:hypothetical protein